MYTRNRTAIHVDMSEIWMSVDVCTSRLRIHKALALQKIGKINVFQIVRDIQYVIEVVSFQVQQEEKTE